MNLTATIRLGNECCQVTDVRRQLRRTIRIIHGKIQVHQCLVSPMVPPRTRICGSALPPP